MRTSSTFCALSGTTRDSPTPTRAAAISTFISFHGGLASVLTSDGTLATVAAAMLMMLVRPRLRTRARPDMAAEMRAARTLGSTVVCFIGTDDVIVSITPNARQVLGEACDRAADLELTLADLIQPEAGAALRDWLGRAWLTEPPPACVVPTRGPYADRRWLQLVTAGPVELQGQQTILVEILDVTDQAKHHNHARLLARALDAGTDTAWITDLDGRFEYVNGAFEKMFGYRSAEVLGRPVSVLSSGRHRPEYFTSMWQALADGEPFRGEVLNRCADGALCTVDLTITRLAGDDTTPARYIATARDITGHRRAEGGLDDLAYYDALTGLANERLLRERARQALALVRRHGGRAALLQVDISNLSEVNARYGRAVGDSLLRTVADRLKPGLRESDTLGRTDGAQFVVLLSDASDDQSIARVVQRLHQAVSKPLTLRASSIGITCRIGVALYPQDADSFDDLVAASDVARRRAEHAESSFEFFEQSVSAASHDRLMLEEDLHWAWEHEQFVLHYQPIVETPDTPSEVAGRHVIGVEALARWPHMERGMLEPAHFIPIAERTGRILSLDRWAIATATRQAASWIANGWDGWVSVNLSARSLQDGELPEYVERTLCAHELDGRHLVVEITEAAAMRDPAQTSQVLEALRGLGVLIALDDFGLGQSSLTCVKLFPVDLLKLDRCCIGEIGGEPREEQLVEIMIALAHRLGARVIAKGVEEEAQMRWLRRAGCDYVQGHLTGKPAAAEVLPHPTR